MKKDENENLTHFGFQSVNTAEKKIKVAEVFNSVAKRYDLMNDLMSFGLHRIWKKIAIDYCQILPNQQILDIAGGSGDLSFYLSSKINEKGKIILADINESMLTIAKNRFLDAGLLNKISLVQADAENLPFPTNYFDRIIISFGLRNVTHKEKALSSFYQTLKPGGKLLILEFSKTETPFIKQGYDFYSFNLLPFLGRVVTGDSKSYQYLAESIRMHPSQEELKKMLLVAGFDEVKYINLLSGIVAIHIGLKF